jgi:hypothetical protein
MLRHKKSTIILIIFFILTFSALIVFNKIKNWGFDGQINNFILLFTGIIVFFYTVETYNLRKITFRQNEEQLRLDLYKEFTEIFKDLKSNTLDFYQKAYNEMPYFRSSVWDVRPFSEFQEKFVHIIARMEENLYNFVISVDKILFLKKVWPQLNKVDIKEFTEIFQDFKKSCADLKDYRIKIQTSNYQLQDSQRELEELNKYLSKTLNAKVLTTVKELDTIFNKFQCEILKNTSLSEYANKKEKEGVIFGEIINFFVDKK